MVLQQNWAVGADRQRIVVAANGDTHVVGRRLGHAVASSLWWWMRYLILLKHII
jgi:hypothetical protein